MTYSVTLSGFQTKEQARKWLNWYEGQGEQDETIAIWMDEDVVINCDVKTGMIEHEDGWEYKVNVYGPEEVEILSDSEGGEI